MTESEVIDQTTEQAPTDETPVSDATNQESSETLPPVGSPCTTIDEITQEQIEEFQRDVLKKQQEYEERVKEAEKIYLDNSIHVQELTKELKKAKRDLKDSLEEYTSTLS